MVKHLERPWYFLVLSWYYSKKYQDLILKQPPSSGGCSRRIEVLSVVGGEIPTQVPIGIDNKSLKHLRHVQEHCGSIAGRRTAKDRPWARRTGRVTVQTYLNSILLTNHMKFIFFTESKSHHFSRSYLNFSGIISSCLEIRVYFLYKMTMPEIGSRKSVFISLGKPLLISRNRENLGENLT